MEHNTMQIIFCLMFAQYSKNSQKKMSMLKTKHYTALANYAALFNYDYGLQDELLTIKELDLFA